MARSKGSDNELRSAQTSRPTEGGSQPDRSKNKGSAAKGNGFADKPGDTYAQAGNFNREWHDDSGAKDAMRPQPDLGPAAALADGIRDAASSAARAVKQQAAAVVNEIGNELGKTAEEQVNHGAEAIRGFAMAIEAAGTELEKVSPQLARYVNDSADKIREVSRGLSNRQVNDLIRTATDFARSQPAIFLGATVAAGFLLARFLKSSAKHDADNQMMAEGDRYMRDGDRYMSERDRMMGGTDLGSRFDDPDKFATRP
jgi:hypothetical protein